MDESLVRMYHSACKSLGVDSCCRGKKRYFAESSAQYQAVRSTRVYGKPMTWYPCPFCGHWHVGTKMDIKKTLELSREYEDRVVRC